MNSERLKCECGRAFTFTGRCRHCTLCKRLAVIEYAKRKYGQCSPNYNVDSISIIENYGKEQGYNFQHTKNGGEFHVKELGYWVDAYDKEQNAVLEIDKFRHFNFFGELKEKDVIRQKEIESLLGCKFIRIKYGKH